MTKETALEQLRQAWRYKLVAGYAIIMIILVWVFEMPEWLGIAMVIGFAVLVRVLAQEILVFGNFLPRVLPQDDNQDKGQSSD